MVGKVAIYVGFSIKKRVVGQEMACNTPLHVSKLMYWELTFWNKIACRN